MQQKEKIFIFFQRLLFFLFLLTFPLGSLAQTDSVITLINNLATFLRQLVASIGIIAIVLAGYYILTAEGDPGKLEKGRQALFWGIIGIGIAAMATGIKNALCDTIGGCD